MILSVSEGSKIFQKIFIMVRNVIQDPRIFQKVL